MGFDVVVDGFALGRLRALLPVAHARNKGFMPIWCSSTLSSELSAPGWVLSKLWT
jgi:hypothetical protein